MAESLRRIPTTYGLSDTKNSSSPDAELATTFTSEVPPFCML